MHRPRFLTSVRVLAAAALLPFLMIETPADTTCTKKDVPMGCRTRTVFSEYPDPVIICVQGHPIVQIESFGYCDGILDGSTLLLRCGTNGSSFSYTGNVAIHTVGTTSNWENLLYGNCSHLTYGALWW